MATGRCEHPQAKLGVEKSANPTGGRDPTRKISFEGKAAKNSAETPRTKDPGAFVPQREKITARPDPDQ